MSPEGFQIRAFQKRSNPNERISLKRREKEELGEAEGEREKGTDKKMKQDTKRGSVSNIKQLESAKE